MGVVLAHALAPGEDLLDRRSHVGLTHGVAQAGARDPVQGQHQAHEIVTDDLALTCRLGGHTPPPLGVRGGLQVLPSPRRGAPGRAASRDGVRR